MNDDWQPIEDWQPVSAPLNAQPQKTFDTAADSAARGLPPLLGGLGNQPAPTMGQSLRASAPGELFYGAKMGLGGVGQFLGHTAEAITGNETLKGINARGDAGLEQERRKQELARRLAGTDILPGWSNPGEPIGRAAVQAPILMAMAPEAAPSLGWRALQGLITGGTAGITTPVTDTSKPYWQQSGTNAAVGGVIGLTVPLISSAINAATRPSVPPGEKAKQLILDRLQKEGMSPSNAVDVINRYPDKQTTLMDVGGQGVQRLARTVNTLPGEGADQISTFLGERQADQHARVIDDINRSLASGGDPYQIAQNLIEQRSKTVQPLYEQAYAANKNIDSSEVDRILETPAGRKALADARNMMMNDRKLMGVPDAELRLQALESGTPIPKGGVASGLKLETLDYVKKALDDQTSAAIRAGETRKAGILSGLTKDFRNALDAADITARAGPNSTKAAGGLYAQARAAFSGPSQSLDALEQGKNFLKINSPNELADMLNNLEPSDRDFFRIGAASALRDRVNSAGDNYDAVTRTFGNQRLRDQISAVFGKDAANSMAESMGAERMATQTNRFVTGGSNTANKLADIADGGLSKDAAEGFIQGGLKGMVRKPLLNMARTKIDAYFNGMTPEVRSALADLLTKSSIGPGSLRPVAPIGPIFQQFSPPAITGLTAASLARLLAGSPSAQQY